MTVWLIVHFIRSNRVGRVNVRNIYFYICWLVAWLFSSIYWDSDSFYANIQGLFPYAISIDMINSTILQKEWFVSMWGREKGLYLSSWIDTHSHLFYLLLLTQLSVQMKLKQINNWKQIEAFSSHRAPSKMNESVILFRQLNIVCNDKFTDNHIVWCMARYKYQNPVSIAVHIKYLYKNANRFKNRTCAMASTQLRRYQKGFLAFFASRIELLNESQAKNNPLKEKEKKNINNNNENEPNEPKRILRLHAVLT